MNRHRNHPCFIITPFDSLTGLYSLRARYYNPALARFLSQDTYPYNFGNPVELNRYVYAANNSINLTDPTGRQALAEYSMLIGTVAGGVAGGLQAYICRGSLGGILEGAFMGAIMGLGFGVTYAYLPGLALGGGMLFGVQGALSAVQNAEVNGPSSYACNGFTLVASLLMVAFSAYSLNRLNLQNGMSYPTIQGSESNWSAGMPGRPDIVKPAIDPIEAPGIRRIWGDPASRNSPANMADMVIRLFNGDLERFNNFLNTLNTSLPEGTHVYIRGSAVNGYKWVVGRPFDGGITPSDIDLVLTGSDALNLWTNGGEVYLRNQTQFASSEVPKPASPAPALYDLILELERQTGRGVNFVGMTDALFKFRILTQDFPYIPLLEK